MTAHPEPLKPAADQPEIAIRSIYVKDLSFEAPQSPHKLDQETWEPEVLLDLNTNTIEVEQDIYEVELTVTTTVKSHKEIAFLVEVKYAGIFFLAKFPPDQLHAVLGSVCPAILFPYVREVISDIVMRGGFPQLLLAPVNFEAIYMQQMQEKAAQTEQEGTKPSTTESDSVH